MSIHVKSTNGAENLSPTYNIQHNALNLTNANFVSSDNTQLQPIYTGYIHNILTNSTSTHVTFKREWSDSYRYLWIDMNNSFAVSSYSTYPLCYSSSGWNSYLFVHIDRGNYKIILEHSADWYKYEVWITLCMCS